MFIISCITLSMPQRYYSEEAMTMLTARLVMTRELVVVVVGSDIY